VEGAYLLGERELKKAKKKLKGISKTKLKEKVKKNQKKINNVHRSIDELKEMVDASKEDFTGMCPVLKEKCDRIAYNPKTVKKWEKNIAALRRDVNELEEKDNRLEKKLSVLESVEELKNIQKTAKSELKAMPTLEKSLKQNKVRLEAVKKQLKEGLDTKTDRKLSELNDTIDQLSTWISNRNQKLGAFQSELKRVVKVRKKIKRLVVTESSLEQNVVILKYIALMFGKNGIPSQEIENAFDQIEDDINFILEKMHSGLEVSFSADRETNQWEENCIACSWRFPKGTRLRECESCGESRKKKRRDELSLKVLEHGTKYDFEMDSCGGKVIISTAVRIALTRLKQRQTGSNFMVLFMDEPDASLDEYNSESFMNLITRILTKHFGFQQIFWLSHNKSIQGSIPHLLMVDRYKKYSKVRWI